MPKLNSVVENLDDVDETIREYYAEQKDKEGKAWFVLQFDDDLKGHPTLGALQRALDAQKVTNKELKARCVEAEKKAEHLPEDFKPDEWERLRQLEKEFIELKEKGPEVDPEKKKAHEAEIQSFKKTHEQQVAKLQKQMDEAIKERDSKITSLGTRVQNMVIKDGLVRLLAENGVKKEVLPYVQAKLERSAKVIENDDGDPIMMFETDMGEIPGDQFIPKWAQSDEARPFVEQQAGGGAPGGRGGKGMTDQNPWSAAHWDMRRQSEILKKDSARADRMARQVGHKKAPGALRMDAK